MRSTYTIRRYRHWYAKLLRLYPKPYCERFGEGMAQTFTDLLLERTTEKRGVFRYALWMFAETSVGLIGEHMTHILAQNKNIVHLALVTGCLLLVPLVAMQFTEEVNWNLLDFVVMGALIFGMGLVYQLVTRRARTTVYRVAFGIGLGGAFLLAWVNGAVGIIGNEGNPANLLYGGVFGVGFIGSLLARFKPRGMSYTLFVAACAQMMIPVIAFMIWPPPVTSWSPSVFDVFGFNVFFAMLFVVSALVFRRASTTTTERAEI